jgi:hypothetical protein
MEFAKFKMIIVNKHQRAAAERASFIFEKKIPSTFNKQPVSSVMEYAVNELKYSSQ